MRVIHLESAESTQDVCFDLLKKQGGPLAVRADVQTRGRGRLGRSWHSPPGGLWLSVGLEGADGLACSLAGPVALLRAVSPYLPEPALIKPPNDIVYRGKKLAGVLVEKRGGFTVVGFGLNVYQEGFPQAFNATSLRMARGSGFTLKSLSDALIESFMSLAGEPFSRILREYNSLLCCVGKRVRVGTITGVFQGVSGDGFLVGEETVGFGRFSGMEVLDEGTDR